MSKSTPLANLPNLKRQGPTQAHEQHENQIVKEILNEIDNSSANSQAQHSPPAQAPSAGPSAEEQAALQQQIQQQMMEQQLMEEQMHQQQMLQEQAANPGMVAGPSPEMMNQVSAQPTLSMIESLMASLKPTAVVAVIVALLSLPFVAETINKIIASKESLKKMALPIMLAIKALVGGGMFFAANNSGMLN